MIYFAKVELYPTMEKPRHIEMKRFDYYENMPNTPFDEAIKLFSRVGEVLEVISQEDM